MGYPGRGLLWACCGCSGSFSLIPQVWRAFPESLSSREQRQDALEQGQLQDMEPAGHPFPLSSPPSSSPPLIFQQQVPLCTAVLGVLWLCGTAGQCRCCCSCAVSSLPGCGSAMGEGRILSPSSEGSAWTQATCPSAHTICKMVFPAEIPALLPLSSPPWQLQLLYRFSLQSTLQVREKLAPFILPLSLPAAMPSLCTADTLTAIL